MHDGYQPNAQELQAGRVQIATAAQIAAGTRIGSTGAILVVPADLVGPGGVGNVVGPASSTDNAVTRFDGATGLLIQNSVVTMSDSGLMTWTSAGQAITAGSYQIGRDADATNNLHFNVPTGAGMEMSVNDVGALVIASTRYVNVTEALAVGTSNPASTTLDVRGNVFIRSTDTSASMAGNVSRLVNTEFNVFPSGATNTEYRGYSVDIYTSAAAGNITGAISSFRSMVRIEANHTFSTVNGALFVIDLDVGTITEGAGLRVSQDYSGGAIGTSYGIIIPAIVGAIAPTTAYGLKVDSPGIGGTQWTMYSTSGNNAFGGNSRFGGVTAPTVAVDVTGSIRATTSLILEETGAGTDTVTIQVPASIAASYTLTLPVDDGTANQVLTTDGSGVLSWSANSSEYLFLSTANNPDALVLSVPLEGGSGTSFLHICQAADNAFDWFNGGAPGSGSGATVFFHSSDQVRNEFTFLTQDGVDFVLQGSTGDDADGVTTTDEGVGIKIIAGDGGTSGLGGAGGDVEITTGAGGGTRSGGTLRLTTGLAGQTISGASPAGGNMIWTTGNGENSDGVTAGGAGGSIQITTGNGGNSSGAVSGGKGGDFSFILGNGGGGTNGREGKFSASTGQTSFQVRGTANPSDDSLNTFMDFDFGAYTTLTADTELAAAKFRMNQSWQWTAGGGTFTNQRFAQFLAPTIAFTSADTITNTATVYVDAAPVAGTNATLTNAYAIWSDAGTNRFDGDMLMSSKIIEDGTTVSSGAGAIAITGRIHEITTTGVGDALTLANGTEGQRLTIIYVAEGAGTDTAILTPTSMGNGTTVTFAVVGDLANAVFTNGKWYFWSQGAVIA